MRSSHFNSFWETSRCFKDFLSEAWIALFLYNIPLNVQKWIRALIGIVIQQTRPTHRDQRLYGLLSLPHPVLFCLVSSLSSCQVSRLCERVARPNVFHLCLVVPLLYISSVSLPFRLLCLFQSSYFVEFFTADQVLVFLTFKPAFYFLPDYLISW